MTRIDFLKTIKGFYKGEKNIVCNNKRKLPVNCTFEDLKQAALKYGFNYSFDSNKNLVIKLTDRQLNEMKLMP